MGLTEWLTPFREMLVTTREERTTLEGWSYWDPQRRCSYALTG
jgi:hypothetical protein